MKGEFLIQVNVGFGTNSSLELSQETFMLYGNSDTYSVKIYSTHVLLGPSLL